MELVKHPVHGAAAGHKECSIHEEHTEIVFQADDVSDTPRRGHQLRSGT